MQFKEAEIELFIEEKNILSIRSQKIVMFIQSPESQKLEGYLMIRKMILALGFNAEEIRWAFYSGNTDPLKAAKSFKEDEINLILVCLPISTDLREPVVEIIDSKTLITIPNPENLVNNEDLKRVVWKVLKPFSAV